MGRLKTVLNKPIEPNNGVVPRKEGLWFAAGVAGQNISCGLVSGWFYYFCTDVAYYDMRVIAFVLTFARIWDAVNDPLMGVLIDRHRFKNGEKLRPWLKLTPFIVGICAILMFVKPAFLTDRVFLQGAFILLIYLVYDMTFTMQDVSMWGMTAVMSPHSDERSRLSQWGRIGGTVGSWLPGLISVFVSLGNRFEIPEKIVFAVLGVTFGFGGMMLSVLSSKAKERVRSVPEKGAAGLRDNLGDLFKNRTVMMVLLGSILSGFSLGVPAVYFFKYKVSLEVLGFTIDGMTASFIFGLVSGLPGTLAMLIAPQFAKKVGGMKNILILSCLAAIVFRILCFFVGYEGYRIVVVMLLMAVASIPAGLTGIAMTSLFGDSIDYMEWKTGRRAEAITFAAQTFASKIVGAINTGVITGLLILLDYSAEAYNEGLPLSPAFDKWVWPLYILGPIVGSVLNVIPLLFIRYPDSLKQQVEADLKARRAESAAEAHSAAQETAADA